MRLIPQTLGPPAGGGEDHHLHQHHSNHDWLLSSLPITSFGPFYSQTSHMHGPAMARTAFLGGTHPSPSCTPATTIILSAIPGSPHHLPVCPLLRGQIYLSPAMTPPAMPSPSMLSEDTTISVFPLPLPYGAFFLSSQPVHPHVFPSLCTRVVFTRTLLMQGCEIV